MTIKTDFEKLVAKLKVDRDEINVKLHLASMDAKEEFAKAEKQWAQVKAKAVDIAGATQETSAEALAKAKVVAEELQAAYQRIKQRLGK